MHDFLIVGGGVIGLSTAWELSRRGKSVCVVDRSPDQSRARGASWVAAGVFPPPRAGAAYDPTEQMRTVSHELHKEWSARLLAETGIDNQLRRCGGLYVARQTGEAVALRVAMQEAQAECVNVIEVTGESDSLDDYEPKLASIQPQVEAAFYLPDEMQIRPPRHLQALTKACLGREVEIRTDIEVGLPEMKGDRVVGFNSSAGSLEANQYVVCGGSWSPKLLESFGIRLPIEPWRGQLILWKTETPLLSHVLNEGLRYLVPRNDGHLVVGATVEDTGFDRSNTDEAIEELKAYSLQLLPDLRGHDVIDQWAGLRPKTPDGVPFVGRVSGTSNLAVATGHYRSGMHLSPATAVFMAQLLLEDTTELDPAAFRLNR